MILKQNRLIQLLYCIYMLVRYDVVSDVGCVRTNNEDMALAFNEQIRDSSYNLEFEVPEDCRLNAIVADGMGGYENGEVASQIATTAFSEFLQNLPTGLEPAQVILKLKEWTQIVNNEIISHAQGSGMGCTLSGLFTYEDTAFVINIGDSRTYRQRFGVFKQLTTDHSERNRVSDENVASNLIYNALGVRGAFIDVTPMSLVPDDLFLICTDGLTDMISDEDIYNILRDPETGTASELVEAAKVAGGTDNITAIIFKVTE